MPIADLARALPDTPRWVETRDMLLTGDAVVTGLTPDRRHFVVKSISRPALIAIVGRPDVSSIAAAAAEPDDDTCILVPEENADYAQPHLPGWRRMGADIHAWPGDVPLPSALPAHEARVLAAPAEVEALEGVPGQLHREICDNAVIAPVGIALVNGRAVAFCSASAVTESLWDCSIDTLADFRRAGHASSAFRALAAHFAPLGKWPVWGSADDNGASRALALKLGFVPAERLTMFLAGEAGAAYQRLDSGT